MAIWHNNFEQGSVEWVLARLGKPTASEFHRILTPKKQQLAEGRHAYARQLVGERLLNTVGKSLDGVVAIERGRELEPQAARHYAFVEGVELDTVGFVTTDDGLIGASPDRLVRGTKIAVELKSPGIENHILYLDEDESDAYICQRQGQLWVAELDRVDLCSYHPNGPAAIIRTHRDEAFIRKLSAAVYQFADEVDELERRMRGKGEWIAHERVTALDRERGDQANAEISEYVQGQFDAGNLGG